MPVAEYVVCVSVYENVWEVDLFKLQSTFYVHVDNIEKEKLQSEH